MSDYSKYRFTKFGPQIRTTRAHMIYTEAQTLDEALTVIRQRRKYRRRHVQKCEQIGERELSPQKPVTLPKLKWMEQ